MSTIDESAIRSWLVRAEDELLEFKREWPNLEAGEGKAAFLKEVLALANSARPDHPGYLVYGIDDELGPDRLCGVAAAVTAERLAQLAASYLQPVPSMTLHSITIEGKKVDIVQVDHDPHRPHHATREISGKLLPNHVYVRRGATIGTLLLPEIETMIRAKEAQFGPKVATEPIISGFVEIPVAGGTPSITGRVVNVTENTVRVSTSWHVQWALNPLAVDRPGGFGARVVGAGESFEDDISLRDIRFMTATEMLTLDSIRIGSRWYDVNWTVRYKDEQGLYKIQEHWTRLTL